MPQLPSGRHVALTAAPFIQRLQVGDAFEIYAVIVAYRLEVRCPTDLLNFLAVVYFVDGGVPPDAPAFASGFTVGMVLRGESDWASDDVESFERWLVEDDGQLNEFLISQDQEINQAIRESIIWESSFFNDDQISTEVAQ